VSLFPLFSALFLTSVLLICTLQEHKSGVCACVYVNMCVGECVFVSQCVHMCVGVIVRVRVHTRTCHSASVCAYVCVYVPCLCFWLCVSEFVSVLHHFCRVPPALTSIHKPNPLSPFHSSDTYIYTIKCIQDSVWKWSPLSAFMLRVRKHTYLWCLALHSCVYKYMRENLGINAKWNIAFSHLKGKGPVRFSCLLFRLYNPSEVSCIPYNLRKQLNKLLCNKKNHYKMNLLP